MKLTPNGSQLGVTDYFTPYDQLDLANNDIDVGSGGVLMLPDQPGGHVHELIGAGKQGTIYLVDRDNMGHYNPNDNSQIVQNIPGQISGMFANPTYWNNNVYFGSGGAQVKAFSLTNGLLSTTETSQSPTLLGYPGDTPVTSSNGTNDGIVWALQTSARLNDGYEVLHAYDATNLGVELYNTTRNEERDNPGPLVKFDVPTVANGKVYTGAVQQVSAYGLFSQPQPAATPAFTPRGGTYTTAQDVIINDTTPGATIYYTTDGSTPTTSSPIYTNPIIVSGTNTIKAIATAPNYDQSDTGTAPYTVTTDGGGAVNFGSGFQAALAYMGSAKLSGSRLQLTDGGTSEFGAVWYTTAVNVQSFTQDFSFQLTNPRGDGMTFVIQNGGGTTAIGPGGAGLGYGASSPQGFPGIPNSVAIKFDLYSNFGEGNDSTGLYTDGASPTIPALDMTSSGVNLHSGNVFNVHMTYDGATLSMTITDSVTHQTFSKSWPINIPATVGAPTAFIGFTGGSGGVTAIQEIVSWKYSPSGPNFTQGFSSDGLILKGAGRNGSRIRLTDGGPGRAGAVWYSTPINVQAFTQDFSFQLTNPVADGFAFVMQNAGTSALGQAGAGLGYGATSPGGGGGIPNSVAVKFDLYDNFGEGFDSTGLYTGGASPSIPAVDMTTSGVNLHSGDIFNVHMVYDGATLSMTLTDAYTNQTFSTSWQVDIPTAVGGTAAYFGFTGGTGGAGAIQEILNWTLASPAAIYYGNGFTATGITLKGNAQLNGSRLRLTDGRTSEKAAAWYSQPVNVQAFTQSFSFQLTNPRGDGFTFTIQNAGPNAIGPGGAGLGYGATKPSGPPGIPSSVAIKFDFYSNFGEGLTRPGFISTGARPPCPPST